MNKIAISFLYLSIDLIILISLLPSKAEVPSSITSILESLNKKVYPQASVIEIIQDKSKQKNFYQNHGIPTSSFNVLTGSDEIKNKVSWGEISFPFIWKASKMGYDGYGVKKIIDNKTLEEITNSHCIIEELIDI